MGIAGRIRPDSSLANLGHRGLMAVATPRLAGRSDSSSKAIARALFTTAVGRFAPEERAWIARIEERRLGVDGSADEPAPMCPFWSVPRIWGRLQLRLVSELAPRTSLELGTAFGISASYQAAALELARAGRFLTLDREPQLIPIATETFAELGLDERVEQRIGSIGETLPGVARELEPIDYAYIDAEHTEQATIENFEVMLPHLADGGVVVVDDILLNDEMEAAWNAIRANPQVTLELNLRRFGIVVVGASPGDLPER